MSVSDRLGRVPALVWSLGLLVGLYGWLLFDVLFLGRTFVGGDPERHHFPLLSLVRPLWALEGGLPLWNPLVAAGQPWAANPEQAAFHPLTALFLILPPGRAFVLQVLLPVAAAALGGYFLGRALALSRTASLLLAVTWGFGGVLLSAAQYFPTLFAAATLPWVLGYAARIARGQGLSALAGLALSEGLLCAAGEPTQILLSAPLALVAAWHASRRRSGEVDAVRDGSSRARVAGLVVAGIALGIVVAAPTLLPGFLHSRMTVRAGQLPPAADAGVVDEPLAFRRAPRAFRPRRGTAGKGSGRERAEERLAGAALPGREDPFLESIYPGLLATLLAGFAWSRRDRGALAWAGVALVAGLIALGTHAPAWEVLRKLPVFSGTRYPEKFLVFVGLAVSISAACGLDALTGARDRARRGFAVATAVLAAAAVVGSVVLSSTASEAFPGRILAGNAPVQSLLAAAGAVLVLALRPGRIRRAIPAAILLVVGVDLVARGRSLLRTGTTEELESLPPQAEQLRARPPQGYLFHAASQRLALWRLSKLGDPPAMARFGIATAFDLDFGMTELAWSARATETILAAISGNPDLAGPVFRRRSVAAILRFRPGAPQSQREAENVPRGQLLELLAVHDPQPMAFCAERLLVVDGEGGWRKAVSSLGERAVRTACVDAGDARGLPASVSSGRVAILERRPTSIRMEIDVDGAGAGVRRGEPDLASRLAGRRRRRRGTRRAHRPLAVRSRRPAGSTQGRPRFRRPLGHRWNAARPRGSRRVRRPPARRTARCRCRDRIIGQVRPSPTETPGTRAGSARSTSRSTPNATTSRPSGRPSSFSASSAPTPGRGAAESSTSPAERAGTPSSSPATGCRSRASISLPRSSLGREPAGPTRRPGSCAQT